MIREIGRGITERNPVWVVPLALPIVLFASSTWEMTVFFALAVPTAVFITHLVAIPLERWLPPDLMLLAMLLAGGVVVTLAERVLYASGIVLPTRPLLLFRAITVSGVMLWPMLVGSRHEPVSQRLNRVAGLVIGFVLGLILLALVRTSLVTAGFAPAGSLPFALIVLALGRIAVNQVMIGREKRARPGESGGKPV